MASSAGRMECEPYLDPHSPRNLQTLRPDSDHAAGLGWFPADITASPPANKLDDWPGKNVPLEESISRQPRRGTLPDPSTVGRSRFRRRRLEKSAGCASWGYPSHPPCLPGIGRRLAVF